MSKGKYAERAKNKREADQRHAIAVAEGNRLRRQVHELRSLREENETLKRKVANLIEKGRPEVEELRSALDEIYEAMDKLTKDQREILQFLNERQARLWEIIAKTLPHNGAYDRLQAALLEEVETNGSWFKPEHEKQLKDDAAKMLRLIKHIGIRREAQHGTRSRGRVGLGMGRSA